jgi:hypothetical protein
VAIITVEELAAFMGKTFTASESEQAQAIIDVVEGAIESETGASFTPVLDDVVRVQADGHGIVELKSKPVTDVSSVLNMDGEEIQYWEFDGLATIYNLFPQQVVDITYSHGFNQIPRDIRGVALGVASRVLYNPAGLRQETVGAISVTYPGIGGEAGTINFSSYERGVLRKYGDDAASMRLATTKRRVAGMPILTLNNHIN